MGSKHAVLVSYLALFVALGGTATALQGRYSVKADDLASGSVGRRALKAKSVSAAKLAGQAVGPRNIRSRSIGAGHLRGRAVHARALAQRSVGRFNLKPGAVDEEALRDGAVTSSVLAPQTEVSFGLAGSVLRNDSALRLVTKQLEWAPVKSGPAPIALAFSPTGGGGLILDGTPGPQSGYLRLMEGSGLPLSIGDSATLVARDDGTGRTQLVVFWEGGNKQVLATEP